MKRVAKAGTLLLLVLTISAGAVIPAAATDTPAAPCDEGRWPATVQGKPGAFTQGGRAGYYVWHDARGWHMRTTTPTRSPHPFSGTIVSSGDIKVVRQYKDEGRDTVTVNGNRMTFSFVTYNGVDGLDFKVGCTRAVSFSLKAYNRLVPASRIWLGRDGTARSNPFTVKRVS